MTLIVVVSNVAVQYPINDWLTWGAFTYPFAFLVTDLTNRALGAEPARRIVYVGFALAVGLSAIIATPRIATASGTAFLMGQLADVAIFDRLRRVSWWRAPVLCQNSALCLLFIHPPAHGSEVSSAARNTLDSARIPAASKLLICGLFQKGRVLAQDGIVLWSRLARPSAADNAQLRSGHEHRIHLLTPLRYLVRMNRR